MFSFILGVIVLILLGVMVWEGTDPSLQEFVLYDEARSRVILFSSASQCLVGTLTPTPTPTRIPAQAGKREWESVRYRCQRLARHRKKISISDGSVYTLEMELGTRGVYVNREKGVTLLRIVAPGRDPSDDGMEEDLGKNTAIDIESTTFPYHRLMFSGDRILLWKRGVFEVESYLFDRTKKSFKDGRGQSVTIWLYPEENKMVWMATTAEAAGKEGYQTLRISWIPSAFGA